MKTSDFYYDLPEELIAQDPLLVRSSSRLMHLDKKTGAIKHDVFSNIVSYLEPGDTLVINDTKVIPARLLGVREGTLGHVEILLLVRKSERVWETLVRPGKKCRTGTRVLFGGETAETAPLIGEIKEVLPDGNRLVEFTWKGVFEEVLDALGEMPLPPYIHHKLEDKDRYNTVYATHEGSAAAPTAGLHFTKELLAEVERKGIEIARVTLHVGLGTFRPVKVEDVETHTMHSEYFVVEQDACDKVNRAHREGHRVICVGTTSCRTIESAAVQTEDGRWEMKPTSGWTQIFIYPGYKFKLLDCLITNFHLPESTLLMLVSALAGKEHILAAYEEAVRERYRFFSFGDAMLIE